MTKETRILCVICLLAIALVIGAIFLINDRFTSASTGVSETPPVTIVLDAGHGGFDGGAVGVSGVEEKELNLLIAKKLEKLLKLAGFEVIMTRTTDAALSENAPTIRQNKAADLHRRLEIAENTENSILLSIHQNMYSEEKYWGTQVFYGGRNSESEVIAEAIQQSVASLLQPENTRHIKLSTDSIYILHKAECPAVLVECGFLSNKREEALLRDETYQRQLAFAISAAICDT